MQWRNDRYRYGALAQAFHWVIAAGFVFQFALAWYMEDLPNTPAKIELYNLHKSVGVTLLVLAALRLAWRAFNPAPPLPAGRPAWEELAARASHVALYAVLFAQPITGLAFSLYAEFPTIVWGWTLPDPGFHEATKNAFFAAHFYLSWVVLALVGVHIAAALRHHIALKDDVLLRMLPARGRRTARARAKQTGV
jgi:cytochrome b561